MSNRVLIAESDGLVRQQLSEYFDRKGYITKNCASGESALSESDSDGVDLVLLSLDMLSSDNRGPLTQLRQQKKVPVIILAKPEQADRRILSLNDGADDFFLKPLKIEELFAKAEALLRRIRWSVNRCVSCGETLVADDLSLSRTELKAFYSGVEVPLTPIQFRLLWVLVENRNEVLSKPYLYKVVLEKTFSRYDRSLDMHLSRVRRKFLDCGMTPERFSTIHGKGYRFA